MKNKMKMLIKYIISKLPLKNIIILEGSNDLDSNTAAFFDYLIKNNFNRKYKIIWLIKNKLVNKVNYENVKFYNIYNSSIICKLSIMRAKYLIYDNYIIEKWHEKQISIYLTHGFPTVKNVKGIINVPKNCNYFLCTSEQYIKHAIEQYNVTEKQIFINDLPRNDQLLEENDDITKIIGNIQYNKVIMWMPTFRKACFSERNDSDISYSLGIPLISNQEEYNKLNDFLNKMNILLIIKLHPGQDLSVIKIEDLSNIKIYSTIRLYEIGVKLYKVLKNVDALISDYSTVHFDYMLLDKPIAYVIDDIEHYKIGFAFDNVYDYMPGYKISKIEDIYTFIKKEILDNEDIFVNERNKIKNEVHKYKDGKNCERLCRFLKL